MNQTNQTHLLYLIHSIVLSLVFSCPIKTQAEPNASCGDHAARAELVAMKEAEQTLRRALFMPKQALAPEAMQLKEKELEELDLKNQAALDRIIKLCGWPGYSTFGRDAARAAEMIAVHAEKRSQYFPIIDAEFKKNNVSEDIYALLVDKILIDEGKLQRYGSQIDLRSKQPTPIEDPDHVNERRAKLGLPMLDGFPVPAPAPDKTANRKTKRTKTSSPAAASLPGK